MCSSEETSKFSSKSGSVVMCFYIYIKIKNVLEEVPVFISGYI